MRGCGVEDVSFILSATEQVAGNPIHRHQGAQLSTGTPPVPEWQGGDHQANTFRG